MAVKAPGLPTTAKMQGPVARGEWEGEGSALIPRTPLQIQFHWGEGTRQKSGAQQKWWPRMSVGSLKLEGAGGALWARSGARRATGHGARGRTGRTRSPRGARGGAHSRGLSPARSPAAAPSRPRGLLAAKDGLPTHMHFAGGCLGNPASRPASLATLCTRACPEVTQERQKGSPIAAAGQKYPRGQHPSTGNPRGEVEDQSSREDLVGTGWSRTCSRASRKEPTGKGQGGGVRDPGPAGVSRRVARGPAGRWDPRLRERPGRGACARVAAPVVSRRRRSSAQTPDGKGGRDDLRPRQPPTSRSSSSKCRNFSQGFESRAPRPRWGSARRRRDAARLRVLHLPRLRQPLPLSRLPSRFPGLLLRGGRGQAAARPAPESPASV